MKSGSHCCSHQFSEVFYSLVFQRWLQSYVLLSLTGVFLPPSDCSYTCHLECESRVQLDCNQRDREPEQTPSPRSHCSSTAPQHKVSVPNTLKSLIFVKKRLSRAICGIFRVTAEERTHSSESECVELSSCVILQRCT